ncbi:hypothetical protein HDU96_004384 [Phlyctochytrium bullatum]|nr:hypothetical protein HDU96_004384 [Phlyctochytrium bullatum]
MSSPAQPASTTDPSVQEEAAAGAQQVESLRSMPININPLMRLPPRRTSSSSTAEEVDLAAAQLNTTSDSPLRQMDRTDQTSTNVKSLARLKTRASAPFAAIAIEKQDYTSMRDMPRGLMRDHPDLEELDYDSMTRPASASTSPSKFNLSTDPSPSTQHLSVGRIIASRKTSASSDAQTSNNSNPNALPTASPDNNHLDSPVAPSPSFIRRGSAFGWLSFAKPSSPISVPLALRSVQQQQQQQLQQALSASTASPADASALGATAASQSPPSTVAILSTLLQPRRGSVFSVDAAAPTPTDLEAQQRPGSNPARKLSDQQQALSGSLDRPVFVAPDLYMPHRDSLNRTQFVQVRTEDLPPLPVVAVARDDVQMSLDRNNGGSMSREESKREGVPPVEPAAISEPLSMPPPPQPEVQAVKAEPLTEPPSAPAPAEAVEGVAGETQNQSQPPSPASVSSSLNTSSLSGTQDSDTSPLDTPPSSIINEIRGPRPAVGSYPSSGTHSADSSPVPTAAHPANPPRHRKSRLRSYQFLFPGSSSSDRGSSAARSDELPKEGKASLQPPAKGTREPRHRSWSPLPLFRSNSAPHMDLLLKEGEDAQGPSSHRSVRSASRDDFLEMLPGRSPGLLPTPPPSRRPPSSVGDGSSGQRRSLDVIAAQHLGVPEKELPRRLAEEGISHWAAVKATSIRLSVAAAGTAGTSAASSHGRSSEPRNGRERTRSGLGHIDEGDEHRDRPPRKARGSSAESFARVVVEASYEKRMYRRTRGSPSGGAAAAIPETDGTPSRHSRSSSSTGSAVGAPDAPPRAGPALLGRGRGKRKAKEYFKSGGFESDEDTGDDTDGSVESSRTGRRSLVRERLRERSSGSEAGSVRRGSPRVGKRRSGRVALERGLPAGVVAADEMGGQGAGKPDDAVTLGDEVKSAGGEGIKFRGQPGAEGAAQNGAGEKKDGEASHTVITVANDDDDLAIKRDFLIKLARTFAMYGAPSHRLEYHLSLVSKTLEVEADYIVFPGMIMVSFGVEGSRSNTHMIKTTQGFNMGKLAQVNALCLTLTHGLLNIYDAIDLLEAVKADKDYPWYIILATFPVTSFTLCILGFGGNWVDSCIAAVLGTLVGILCLLSERYSSVTYLLEFFASLGTAFIARTLQWAFGLHGICFNYIAIVLSAIAILLPGLSLTISIIELSTRNMVSGTVRLFSALFTAMLLGFGMTIGGALVFWSSLSVNSISASCEPPQSPLWGFLLFWPMSIAVNIFFQANIHQWPIMTASAALGWITSIALNLAPHFKGNSSAVTAISSLVIGLVSNIHSRFTHDVAVAPVLSGILLQVPGSLGVRSSLSFFVSSDQASQSIVDGLFLPVIVTCPLWLLFSSSRLSDWWLHLVVYSLEKAGPLWIKLAQWASSRVDIFPQHVCNIFGRLRCNVKPHAVGSTARVLRELPGLSDGEALLDCFSDFDFAPIGVGAVAQVYKARLSPGTLKTLGADSDEVAVKVVHPGVEELVQVDTELLKVMAKFAMWVVPSLKYLGAVEEVETFAQMMRNQIDLEVEARNLELFRRNFEGSDIAITFPKPFTRLCSRRVLVESFEDGVPLAVFLNSNPTAFDEDLSRLGLLAFMRMLFRHNLTHADLHPGNVLITFRKPKAMRLDREHLNSLKNLNSDDFRAKLEALHAERYQPMLVALDVGMISRLSPKNQENLRDVFHAAVNGDAESVAHLLITRSRDPDQVIEKLGVVEKMKNLLFDVRPGLGKEKILPLSQLHSAQIVARAAELFRKHRIGLDGEWVSLFIACALIEGVGRKLNADMDIFELVAEEVR